VAYLECAKGWGLRGLGTEVPQWGPWGKAPVGGLEDNPQKLKLFVDKCLNFEFWKKATSKTTKIPS